MIRLEDIVGKPTPFLVRYIGPARNKPGKPVTVVGFGDACLSPLEEGHRNTTAVFKGGGWLWLPDMLRLYELVDPPRNSRLALLERLRAGPLPTSEATTLTTSAATLKVQICKMRRDGYVIALERDPNRLTLEGEVNRRAGQYVLLREPDR